MTSRGKFTAEKKYKKPEKEEKERPAGGSQVCKRLRPRALSSKLLYPYRWCYINYKSFSWSKALWQQRSASFLQINNTLVPSWLYFSWTFSFSKKPLLSPEEQACTSKISLTNVFTYMSSLGCISDLLGHIYDPSFYFLSVIITRSFTKGI